MTSSQRGRVLPRLRRTALKPRQGSKTATSGLEGVAALQHVAGTPHVGSGDGEDVEILTGGRRYAQVHEGAF